MNSGQLLDYRKGGLQKNFYSASEVVYRDCPLCAGKERVNLYVERGAVGIVRCGTCGLIYTNPMVKESEKNYWGETEKYLEEARLIFNGRAAHHRDENYREDLARIEKIKPEGNFLDVGTNMGFFLRHTRSKKWKACGVEPSPSLSEIARRYFGLNVKTSTLEDAGFPEGLFDVVTMIDVFEHITEPKRMLEAVRYVIKDDGILFIKVPNGRYNLLKFWLARKTGRLGAHDIFDSYEHLVHYTEKTLQKMLEGSGFEVVNKFVARPIQIPVWHKYVGYYYQYPSPWILDIKNHTTRALFYWLAMAEYFLRGRTIGAFASHIALIARKKKDR